VEYRTGGAVYRAQVVSVGKDAIKLDGITLIDTDDSYKLVSSRLANARFADGARSPCFPGQLPGEQVELIRGRHREDIP